MVIPTNISICMQEDFYGVPRREKETLINIPIYLNDSPLPQLLSMSDKHLNGELTIKHNQKMAGLSVALSFCRSRGC